MRKDRTGGVALRASAAIKEALGMVTGDKGLQAEGAAEKAIAQIRFAAGGLKPGQGGGTEH